VSRLFAPGVAQLDSVSGGADNVGRTTLEDEPDELAPLD